MGEERRERSGETSNGCKGSQMSSARTSARSTQSAESEAETSAEPEVSTEERAREKSRLQRLLKDFAKEAVAGIAVNVVNVRTCRRPPYVFQMDKNLVMFSLRPKDGSAA